MPPLCACWLQMNFACVEYGGVPVRFEIEHEWSIVFLARTLFI